MSNTGCWLSALRVCKLTASTLVTEGIQLKAAVLYHTVSCTQVGCLLALTQCPVIAQDSSPTHIFLRPLVTCCVCCARCPACVLCRATARTSPSTSASVTRRWPQQHAASLELSGSSTQVGWCCTAAWHRLQGTNKSRIVYEQLFMCMSVVPGCLGRGGT